MTGARRTPPGDDGPVGGAQRLATVVRAVIGPGRPHRGHFGGRKRSRKGMKVTSQRGPLESGAALGV